MKHDPNQQKISKLEFPCDFIIKVMGESHPDFETKMLGIVKKHFDDKQIKKVSKRHSKNDTYLSVTFTIYAENKEQLDSLYIELSQTPEVLIAL